MPQASPTAVDRLGTGIASAHPIELKLAYFVGDQHAMSQWPIKWANGLEKDSGGRIGVKRFPGSQMGPMQQHYDLARKGLPFHMPAERQRRHNERLS
jgi:TRAP-type C4-dicarboxylate transport system substrate-binding protein